MPTIDADITLERVEHILTSGTGVLDFSVEGATDYYSWWGVEDAEWNVTGVQSVENLEEDRFIIYPKGDYFRCEIEATGEEANIGPVRCRSE